MIKKRARRLLCVMTALILLLSTEGQVYADELDDAKKKKEETQLQLDELDDTLDELEDEQQGIESEMDELETQISEIMASISILEDEIADKQDEIAQTENDLTEAREDEQEQYDAMMVRIRFMYENGDTNYISLLFEGGSLEDIINQADYIEKLYDYDRQLLEEYQATCEKIEELIEQLEEEESELEMTQHEYEEEQEGLEESLTELQAASDDYELQITKAKQQAEIYKTQIKQQNEQIAKLEEEKRKKEEEEARKKAEAAAQNSTTSTTTTTTGKVTGTATVNKEEILAANGSDLGKEIAIYACGFVGNPYVAGGTSLTEGADCSGFTQAVYKSFGYSIPRTSYAQRSAGTEVSYADAQPGDIICYAGHVAIYIGNGKIVHASGVKTGIKIGYATYREILSVRRIV